MDCEFYNEELNNTEWVVPNYYTDLRHIGEGTYGSVCSALDTRSDPSARVAIKKVYRPFQTPVHAKRTYREMRLMRHMRHDNVIELLDCFTSAAGPATINDVYMVSPLMDDDIRKILQKYGILQEQHVQYLVYEILRGLKYIHSAGVIHRDLKPANVAVSQDREGRLDAKAASLQMTVKILDFGLARPAEDTMTGYVATRWYRAPEIMLNWMHYKQNMDMWSVGCIMAEMITGRVLVPGKTQIDQLSLILDLLGTPSQTLLHKIESIEARKYLASLQPRQAKDFQEVFGSVSVDAADLLSKMLVFDPDDRISVTEALAHPFFSAIACADDEPEASDKVPDDTELNLGTKEWRELIWDEIIDFRDAVKNRMDDS